MELNSSAKTADDSRNEFVNGEAVFYQNGTWEYAELSKTYRDDELAMIPIYFGVDDEKRRTCNRYRELLVCKQRMHLRKTFRQLWTS